MSSSSSAEENILLNVTAIKALFTAASGLGLFQSLTFYQVRFVIAVWQPGSMNGVFYHSSLNG